MRTYSIEYKIGSLGSVSLDIEMDIDKTDPNFNNVLRNTAEALLLKEIENYGDVECFYNDD